MAEGITKGRRVGSPFLGDGAGLDWVMAIQPYQTAMTTSSKAGTVKTFDALGALGEGALPAFVRW